VIIAGPDEALPDAIIKGIDSSVSSRADEDATAESGAMSTSDEDVETIAPSDTEDANGEAVEETSIEAEVLDEAYSGQVTEPADNDQDDVVEVAESDAAGTADNDQGVVEEADSDAAGTADNDQEVVVEETESDVVLEEGAGSDLAAPAAGERWIDVNLTTQMLTAYEGETPILYSAISSGLWQFPTVTGEFRTWIKYESQDMTGYHLGYSYELEDVPHVMYFFEDYAIHGAYWHNNFGTPMSHGCVNMNLYDAEWLYSWAPLGTRVSVHN
jgi:lipoprotein-anchoring transpeptidase ErfK/SrfK